MPEPIIAVRDLDYTYNPQSPNPISALNGVSLQAFPGEYLAILGHNGSGKSTLARHLNVLLRPTSGEVWVKGMDTRLPANTLPIRRTVGMVFQVPDNQIVASVVEEDVAFGPENLGVPEAELHERVEWALDVVGMLAFRHREPHRLSAGQKQRVAIAGVMAMKPEVLVLDEATSMLDPEGRRDVLSAVRKLNDQGVTVVAITHSMDEATEADRVLVLEEGRLVLEGAARSVLSRVEELRDLQLDVPQVTEMAYLLHRRDETFPADLLTVEELVNEVKRRIPLTQPHLPGGEAPEARVRGDDSSPIPVSTREIEVKDLEYAYLKGTPLEVTALRGAILEVQKGEVVAIIGRTGAGKSTVVQHFNGLLRPHQPGRVIVEGEDLSQANLDLRRLRQRVGLAFQYPEQQLFERLVGDDIAFGPKKLGLPRPERIERVQRAMATVGLDFGAFKDRSTFSLSGGEMRKAALAGVLALQPDVLVLDESTSGLDPRSRRELLGRLETMRREQDLTLVLVSPSMEDVAGLADRVYVLDEGRVVMGGPAREVFAQAESLREHGLGVPQVTAVTQELQKQGIPVQGLPLTATEGVEGLWKILHLGA